VSQQSNLISIRMKLRPNCARTAISASFSNFPASKQNRETFDSERKIWSHLLKHQPQSAHAAHARKVATSITPVDSEYDGIAISGVVDAVLEVGRQRKTLLSQLRIALESGKEKEALNLARRLCGLPNE
jgi:hypothetical protein